MIPKAITDDLRNGMGLDECLIKHKTNLKILFTKEYPEEIRCSPEWRYIEKRGRGYDIKKKKFKSTYYFGKYKTLEDAQKVRDKLICIGWKQNQVDNICNELVITRIPGKNEHRYREAVS